MAAVGEATINVSTFVEVLKRSGLVEQKRLEHAFKSVALTSDASRTANDVAEHLVVAGLITKWQAAQLLKGKYRGFTLGKYIIRKPLGKGGMAVVYEAEHSVLNTRVAIKILPKARNDVEKSVSRFLAEARAAAKLNHPNIVRVHDCDVVGDRRFMVMDLVNGSNLGEIVERHGPLSYRNAILMLKQAAAGLAYAHDHGVTHRDVKPHNFLVEQGGQLKVADMGLALFEVDSPDRHTQDGENSIVGTIDYVAPEQAWDSRNVDRRADMYSLGCTLYFMITGHAPFNQGTLPQRLAKHQTATPTPLTQLRPDCPVAIWNLCLKMMAKKPQDRLQRMSEVVRVCDQLLPRLSGGGADIATLTDGSHAGSDSNGWNSGELLGLQESDGLPYSDPSTSFESMSGSLPDLGGGLSMNGGMSMASFDEHLPMPAPVGNPTYWNAPQPSGGSKPKAGKSKKSNKSDSFSDSASGKIVIIAGIGIALSALGLSVWTALQNKDGNEDRYKPLVKQYETGNGDKVIIVQEGN